MKRILPAILAAAVAIGALCGCAHVEPSITQQTKVYRDAPVEKSRLAISIKPRTRLSDAPKALMFPLWVAQKMDNHMLVGAEMGRLMHQAWTEAEIFPTLAYDPQLVYRGPEQAVRLARSLGADLVIVGIVPYFITGGTVDSSAITVQIRIYDTASGNLLLSMDQSARVNAKVPADWVLFTVETRLSDSPIAAAVTSIARDMAVPLKSWLPPTDEELGFADNAQDISRLMLAEGSPLAGPEDTGSSRGLTFDILNSGKPGAKGVPNSVKLKIEFDFDSARIREGSYGLLNELGKALKDRALAGRRVAIAGHTDATGKKDYNQRLSERRAASVKDYLVQRCGIDPATLRTEGYGESRPLVKNSSPANRQRNRRVEVRLDL
jgi:OOP family OmpA-OmpF porin